MFRTWIASDADPADLARALEAHLNEFAGEVISVSYAVSGEHHVLAVYRAIDAGELGFEIAGVAAAEQILEDASPTVAPDRPVSPGRP